MNFLADDNESKATYDDDEYKCNIGRTLHCNFIWHLSLVQTTASCNIGKKLIMTD